MFWAQNVTPLYKNGISKNCKFSQYNFWYKDLPRSVTKKWVKVYDQSGGNYNVNNKIRIKTSMLRSDLCDFNDAYIVVKGDMTVGAPNNSSTAFQK